MAAKRAQPGTVDCLATIEASRQTPREAMPQTVRTSAHLDEIRGCEKSKETW
jgi:hypothetical protein